MYRLVRSVIGKKNVFFFSSSKHNIPVPPQSSSSINLDQIPNDLPVEQVDREASVKKKRGIDLTAVQDTFALDKDGYRENYDENEDDEQDSDIDSSQNYESSELELEEDVIDQYIEKLQANGYDMKNYDKNQYFENIRQMRTGKRKNHLPYIKEIWESDTETGQIKEIEFDELKGKIPNLQKSRAFKKVKDDLDKLELLNNPYYQQKPEEVEYVKHGQGAYSGQISLFLNPNSKPFKDRKKKSQLVKNLFESQNRVLLLENMARNPGFEDRFLTEFVEKFKGQLDDYYLDTLKDGFSAGLINSPKLSVCKKLANLIQSTQQLLPSSSFAQLTTSIFQSLLTSLDSHYSEFTISKLKLLIPFTSLTSQILPLITILSKYQNKTLLPQLVSNHEDVIINPQISDKEFNQLLILCYGQASVNKIAQIVLQRRDESDYESLRAMLFRLKAEGKKIFKSTEKEIEDAYNLVKNRNVLHSYATYVILEIAQLNSCHHIVFDAYKESEKYDDVVDATIQRFYHDSLLLIPILNLQDIILNMIKNQNCNLAFSLKALTKAGYYQETWNIFKQKVLDEVAPQAMAERIRTFFRILYNDYHKASGADIASLLKQSQRFSDTIKSHENYLIDIYNKQNVYNRRHQQKQGFFKVLFSKHETLKNIEFTVQQAEMLYTLILTDLQHIFWDPKMQTKYLDDQFQNAIQLAIKDFLPLKQYMDSVSDYQYKKEWQLHLMQLNIYIEQMRTKSDIVDQHQYQAFQNSANPVIRFVLEQYDLYPLANSTELDVDQMLVTLNQVRYNNYWLRRPNFQDRRVMQENKFSNELQNETIRDSKTVKDVMDDVENRQDKYDDLDYNHVFDKKRIEMQPGEYVKIEPVESILRRKEEYEKFVNGEQNVIHRLDAGEGEQYENGEVGEGEIQENVEGQINEEVEAEVAEETPQVQQAVEQAAEQVAPSQVVQQVPQQAVEQVYQQQPQDYDQAMSRLQAHTHSLQLSSLASQQLYQLGTFLQNSSHIQSFLSQIRKPIIKHSVQNHIQLRNILGQDGHLLQYGRSYHSKRFQDEEQRTSDLGLYDKKIDLKVLKPEQYQEVKKEIDEMVLTTALYGNQDLEHVNEFPHDDEVIDELDYDLINFEIEIEAKKDQVIKADKLEELDSDELQEEINKALSLEGMAPETGHGSQGYEEQQNAQEVEEAAVHAEDAEQAEQTQLQADGQNQPSDLNIEGAYYQSPDAQYTPDEGVLENEYGITTPTQALRLQYFRLAKVQKMWDNPVVNKHLLLSNFTEGLTRDTHIITTQSFEKYKNNFNHFWAQSEMVLNTKADPLVEELISWGVLNEEPLAIYMGQKLAMLTKQQIPHHLAQNVSKLLNLNEDTPNHIREKAKMALQYVGKIEREKIYDFNKCYKHILDNQTFQTYMTVLDKVYDFPNKNTILRLQAKDIRQFAPGKISDSAAWKKLQQKALKRQCDYI